MKQELKTTAFTTALLLGAYLVAQAIADVGATKLVSLGSIVIPGGTFIFALTFTLRDVIHKRLGKDWAIAAILVAGIMNVMQAFYLFFVAKLAAPPFYQNTESWSAIFSIVPSITLGSIAAEVVSELVDTQVYHFIKEKVERFQWLRVVASNAVSLPLDSLIFATLAFVVLPPLFGAEAMPFAAALSLTVGQIVYKGAITVISIPMIYLVKER